MAHAARGKRDETNILSSQAHDALIASEAKSLYDILALCQDDP